MASYENVETKSAPAPTKQPTYSHPALVEPTKPTLATESQSSEDQDKSKSLSRNKGGFLNKFRRSMSLSAESASELTSTLNGSSKSTFYLTETIDVDRVEAHNDSSDKSLSPVLRQSRSPLMRPRSPPPPAPSMSQSDLRKSTRKDGKSSSWYADSGVFRNNEHASSKRPNTFWYAEVGLYQGQQSNSTPSTSSAENSGSNLSTPIKRKIQT